MSECNHQCGSCGQEGCASRQQGGITKAALHRLSSVKKVVGVVSGKGGVGKSLVTALLACKMQSRGLKSAILDADLTGPSIPRLFGLTQRAVGNEDGILPVRTGTGIDVVSMNLLLDNATDPVVWRGPVVAGVIKEFWTEFIWENVDFMFVDMPPGTGDVPLTVFQSLPVDGIIIVTSPQELVSMIVEKAVKMAEMMNIPVLGIVENMSYYECPDCGKRHSIFGESHLEEIAAKHGIEAVARIPIDPDIAKACDNGEIESLPAPWLEDLASALKEKLA
jgi:Mrp family chromosome partitioning ATPase